MVRKSTIKFYGRFMMLYAGAFLTIFILLFTRNNSNMLFQEGALGENMSIIQVIYFYTYKFVLNIPFGFINFLSDKYIWTTSIFVLPDSIFMAWLFAKIYPSDKKNISKFIYYVLIGFGIINFFALAIGVIEGTMM